VKKIWAIALPVLLLDFFSKHVVATHFALFENFPVFSQLGIDFSLTHTTNKGAAWGLFAKYPYILLALRIAFILCLLLLFLLRRIPQTRQWPFALVFAGALGNIIDSFLYGHVIDFLSFTFWGYAYPSFNVADSAIFCGVVLFLLQSSREKKQVKT
jgi:signal peptidase II